MLAALCHALLAFAPRRHKPHPPAEDQWHDVWYFVEDHGEVVFPLVAIAVVALIVLGIRRGMSTNIATLQKKQDQKDAIVRMMRQKLLVSAEAISSELKIDHFQASALLDDLVREGKLVEQKSAGGVANYRLKGL
ncbi:MAG: hypothetical protein ABR567_06875 [Myxococcales bacterium]|nr:hypothetical protein [Myxococcales bacterium]